MLKIILADHSSAVLDDLAKKILLVDERIHIVQHCISEAESCDAINELHPDAVITSFFTEQAVKTPPEFIFSSPRKEDAVKAFKLNALDFLLKPTDLTELSETILKLRKKLLANTSVQSSGTPNKMFGKIILAGNDGLSFIPVKEIVRAQSTGNYTSFHLSNGKKKMVSKTMKEYEEQLEGYNFFRVHKSHMVNMQFISKYVKGHNAALLLTDGSIINVSVRKKASLLERLLEQY